MSDVELDLDFVRSHFPQLKNGWVFFENAGGSYVPSSVADRVAQYMRELQIQPGGNWPQSQHAQELLELSHRQLAEMINAKTKEIVIGPSATLNIYVLSQALKSLFKTGDEIIVSNQDHEANGGAWRRLENEGITIKEWCVNPETAELEIEQLQHLLTDRTRLVCFPHVSNIVGSINDVKVITKLAHEAGALVCVDGVAYAAHRTIDVKAWDVDFYFFSLYKVYGPHLSLLYGKQEHFLKASNQNHFFFTENDIPAKLNPGGQQHELSASLAGIIDYFEAVYDHHYADKDCSLNQRIDSVYELFSLQEERLAKRLSDTIKQSDKIRLIGKSVSDRNERVPTFSFLVKNKCSQDIANAVAKHNIAIRHGAFYANRLMRALGIAEDDGVIRSSMVHYNSLDEVDKLSSVLETII